MPTFQNAKDIAGNALNLIGAFPASQSQADAGELKKTLCWIEMILNTMTGYGTLAGFHSIIEFNIEAGIGDYNLSDYTDSSEVEYVFSASLVDELGNASPLEVMWENDEVYENLNNTGTPSRVVITRDKQPQIRVYPTPTQDNQDSGLKLRLRVQSYHQAINANGNGGEELKIRPSWYMFLTLKTAYHIGLGPVRRLGEYELTRLKNEFEYLEHRLSGVDGQANSSIPPVTEPMAGSY